MKLTIEKVTSLIQFDENSKEYKFLKTLVDAVYENELRNGCSSGNLEYAAEVALDALSRKLNEITVLSNQGRDTYPIGRFCAISHRHGVQEESHFHTKDEAIKSLESGYKNDQCFPDMVIDLLTRQVVWKFDVVKL